MKITGLSFLIFILGCNRVTPPTVDFCIKEVKTRLEFSKNTLSKKEEAEAEMGILSICQDAGNDPNEAVRIFYEIRYSH